MVTWIFGKILKGFLLLKGRNRSTWLSWLMDQAIYSATGLEFKKARLLNWDPYKAPGMDKSCQVPLSEEAPNTLWLLSKPSLTFSVMLTPLKEKWACQSADWSLWYVCRSLALPHLHTSGRLDFELLSLSQILKGSDFKIHHLCLSRSRLFLNKNNPKRGTSSLAVFSLILRM